MVRMIAFMMDIKMIIMILAHLNGLSGDERHDTDLVRSQSSVLEGGLHLARG